MINLDKIPTTLRERPHWVLWKIVQRDKPTKVPFSVNGSPAKANDPSTWSPFEEVTAAFMRGGFAGIGYEFLADDSLCGVDLDGCRDPETGVVADWAREIIADLNTYAEVSPSHTGVKLFGVGSLPTGTGRKRDLDASLKTTDKNPAIECYDRGRYFAVTGWRIKGPTEPQPIGDKLKALCERFWPASSSRGSQDFYAPTAVVDRARLYVQKLPPSVSGQSGHNAAFHAACVLVHGFQLERDQALTLFREWNQLCQPPWSDRECEHKIDSAIKAPGERGYLRNTRPEHFAGVRVPKYVQPQPEKDIATTTLVEAANAYIAMVEKGGHGLIDLGLSDLDYALGGGVTKGEMILIAGRPSHGKSLIGLQIIHNWTRRGMKSLMVSEEMSALAIGKRTLQYISEVPDEHWQKRIEQLRRDVQHHAANHVTCFLAESVRTVGAARHVIEQHVEQEGVECVLVDYAQLLQSPGKSRYEQITNTSVELRQLATKLKIALVVLCQLNRQIESRTKFVPTCADLKDTGQLEQDADVIVFCVWPHRIDASNDPNLYQFFVGKNRNRAINQAAVECRLMPSRQRVEDAANLDQVAIDAVRNGAPF